MKRHSNYVVRISLLLFLVVVAAACSSETHSGDQRLNVVATTSIIADAVKQVGGEYVSVTALMGPGTDPHGYKATQSDVNQLMNADVVFYHGLNLEGKLQKVLEEVGEKTSVFAVTDYLDRSKLLKEPPDRTVIDPHVWFDLSLWSEVVQAIERRLIELNPNRQTAYEENSARYRGQLKQLDDESRTALRAIPKQQRVLLTAHDAFSYFGRAYDIEVFALQGINTDAEYSVEDVSRLSGLIAERNIGAIFAETSISDRSVKAVLEGARKKGATVELGQSLFSDALGAPADPTGTFIGMFKHNVQAVADGLQ